MIDLSKKEIPIMKKKAKRVFKQATEEKEKIKEIITECLRWTFPNNGTLQETVTKAGSRSNETQQQYDDTTVIAATQLVNYLSETLTPAGRTWARFKIDIPLEDKEQKGEDEEEKAIKMIGDTVTETVFQEINKTNTTNGLYQSFENLVGAGTGAIKLIKMPLNSKKAVITKNLPLDNLFFTEDTYENPENVFYKHIAEPIQWLYDMFSEQFIKLDSIMKALNPEEKEEKSFNFVEGCILLKHGSAENEYLHFVSDEKFEHFYYSKKTKYNPFVVFRWAKNNNNFMWGSPILLKTLSNVRTLNELVELEMKKGKASLNPPLIGIISPEALTLMGQNAFTKQIKYEMGKVTIAAGISQLIPVISTYDFKPANVNAQQIRQTLYDLFNVKPLGDIESTKYRTAEEMSLRHQEFDKQFGATYGRLQNELLEPLLKTYMKILKERNKFKLSKEDLDQVVANKIEYINPLAQLEAQEKVQNAINYKMMLSQVIDPEVFQVLFDEIEFTYWIAEEMSIPARVLNDKKEVFNQLQVMQQQKQQYMQMQMQQGMAGPPQQEQAPPPGGEMVA